MVSRFFYLRGLRPGRFMTPHGPWPASVRVYTSPGTHYRPPRLTLPFLRNEAEPLSRRPGSARRGPPAPDAGRLLGPQCRRATRFGVRPRRPGGRTVSTEFRRPFIYISIYLYLYLITAFLYLYLELPAFIVYRYCVPRNEVLSVCWSTTVRVHRHWAPLARANSRIRSPRLPGPFGVRRGFSLRVGPCTALLRPLRTGVSPRRTGAFRRKTSPGAGLSPRWVTYWGPFRRGSQGSLRPPGPANTWGSADGVVPPALLGLFGRGFPRRTRAFRRRFIARPFPPPGLLGPFDRGLLGFSAATRDASSARRRGYWAFSGAGSADGVVPPALLGLFGRGSPPAVLGLFDGGSSPARFPLTVLGLFGHRRASPTASSRLYWTFDHGSFRS